MAEQVVERVRPPRWLVRMANPVVRWLLQSRWHRRVSDALLLLHYRGRRTGRLYHVPVGYHQIDGEVSLLTNSGWRHNFEGGRDVEVTFRGERRPARAALISDPDTVAGVYEDKIAELGVTQAQRRLGIRINADRSPTDDELREAVVRWGLSIVTLELDGQSSGT